ncbi:hypothetical protein F66182_11531, partial [Fusarium sp. NRRL 66182]
MFQRIRGAIDARIAEEQARQREATGTAARPARRPSTRTAATTRQRSNSNIPQTRGPDPKEFEFSIGDDDSTGTPASGLSRAGTPRLETGNTVSGSTAVDSAQNEGSEQTEGGEKRDVAEEAKDHTEKPPELPIEVRSKLRRLDKIESRYHELHKAYKAAHARVLLIESFESALRENTPLTSIGDPKALTEYLNQMSLKNDMLMDELKRVTSDRDDHKKKLTEAEKATKEALDEVAALKEQKKTEDVVEEKEGKEKVVPEKSAESEDFFSFDNEIPRLESEVQEKQERIEKLSTEVDNLKRDLTVARESTESMVVTLESTTRELEGLRDAKDKHESEIEAVKSAKQKEIEEIKSKLEAAESAVLKANTELSDVKRQLTEKSEEIDRLKAEAANATSKVNTSELTEKIASIEKDKADKEKRLGVIEGLVDKLKSQVKEGQETVSSLRTQLAGKGSELEGLEKIVKFVDDGLGFSPKWKTTRESVLEGKPANFDDVREILQGGKTTLEGAPTPAPTSTQESQASTGGKKKKNKKKKGKQTEEAAKETAEEPTTETPST